MKLSVLSPADASVLATRALGIDFQSIALTSTEGLAASLRRAASFMCPTSPSRLIEAVAGAVRPVSPTGAVDRDQLVEILDLLIGAGDLLELRQDAERSTRLLYLAPPSYIERAPGSYLLLGVRPYGAPLVDAELAGQIESEGHTRLLKLDAHKALDQLADNGLQGLSRDRWAANPRQELASELIERVRVKLDVAGSSGQIAELEVLDPDKPARYYRGRWRALQAGDRGDFLGRRPQAYGAPLWCAVRVEHGEPTKIVEFPIDDPTVPARDEAWRYQMAIDAGRGNQQQYRVTPMAGRSDSVVSFFSPVPGFAERQLQLIGLALQDAPKALFAFRVSNSAMPDLAILLADMLWMKSLPEESVR
ncbi:MAG: hypothetical protein HHJ11_11225 [Phycicoccus sp.]|nr:hypothetical protein [Phycicoccus sp.]